MSEIEHGIVSFKEDRRLSDPYISFEVTFSTPLKPDTFKTGETFQLNIMDNMASTGITVFKGTIRKINRNKQDNNAIYGITGYNNGWFLVKQPFNWDCTASAGKTYTTEELLNIILQDTGVRIGRGQTRLKQEISYSTIGTDAGRFCGKFNTKKDAINQLFAQYCNLSGANKIRWHVDGDNYLNWFETRTDREDKLLIFNDDPCLISVTPIEENAENIINDIVVYGGENNEYYNHKQDTESIKTYGLLPLSSPIQESRYTSQDQTDKRAEKELYQKSQPFYTATVNLVKYFDIEPGQQIKFPDDLDYSDITFTVVDKSSTGQPSNIQTTINLTTDETAISIINEMEIVDTVAQTAADEAKPVGATVSGLDETTNTVLASIKGDNVVVSAEYAGIINYHPLMTTPMINTKELLQKSHKQFLTPAWMSLPNYILKNPGIVE